MYILILPRITLVFALLIGFGGTVAFSQSTTTNEAAQAAKRQASTGSSNVNVSKQLNNLDKENAVSQNNTPTAKPPKK